MKWKTLHGKVKEIPTACYRVDWDGEHGSRFSKSVLEFLRPYWQNHVVLAEYPVAGGNMRFDFVNITRRIVIETDGIQHDQYNAHFHRGSEHVYKDQIKRDLKKDDIARLNGFTMVRIKPSDLPLTKEWLEKTFDITL